MSTFDVTPRDIEANTPDLAFPDRLTVELTNRCNLSCTMCPRHKMEIGSGGFMDPALFRKIVEEAKDHLPVALVPFLRGESLLHPQFIEFMHMAKEAGLGPIQLTTNAMLLDEEMSRRIIEARVDFISFSLDVLGKENYEKIRRGGDYDLVIGNVRRFIALRDASGSAVPQVQVSTVQTDENSHLIQDFVEHWRTIADRVRVYPEHSTDGRFGSLDAQGLPAFERRLPCRKLFTDMVIYWNGDVATCNHDWDRQEFIGNVGSESIADIWRGEKYEELRRRHREGELGDDPTCGGCDHWKMYYIEDGLIGKLYTKEDQ